MFESVPENHWLEIYGLGFCLSKQSVGANDRRDLFFFPIAVINFVLVYHPGKKHFPGGLNIFQTESGRRKKTPVVTKSI